ncbi:MAG: hypothetical protein M3134_05605, partial [Actinomycetota bacterium]|nr:hypothetical protein [Actinomycetota bacterium]
GYRPAGVASAAAKPATASEPRTTWSAVFDAIRKVSGPQIAWMWPVSRSALLRESFGNELLTPNPATAAPTRKTPVTTR